MKILFTLFFSLLSIPIIYAQDAKATSLALQKESAELYYAGQYEKSLEVAQQSVDACKAANLKDSTYIEAMFLLADVASANQRFEITKKALEELEPVCIELYGKESQNYADLLNSRGTFYYRQGDYEKAVDIYVQSVNIYRASEQVDPFIFCDALSNLGSTYDNLHRYNQAETYLREAIILAEKNFGKNAQLYAIPVTNLAGVLAKVPSKIMEAEKIYLEALDAWERISGKMHPNYAITVGNVGFFYIQSDQFDKAEKYMLESLELKGKIVGENHIDYQFDLYRLAQVYYGQKKLPEAVAVLTDLMQRFQNLNQTESALYLETLNLLAQYRLKLSVTDSLAQDLILQSLQLNLQLPQKPQMGVELVELLKEPKFILNDKQFGKTQALLHQFFDHSQPEIAFRFSYNNVRFYSQEKNQTLREEDRLPILKEVALAAEASLGAIYKTIQKKKGNQNELLNTAFELSEYNKSMLLQTVIRSKDAANFGNLPDSLIQKERFYKEELAYLKSLVLSPHSENEKADILKNYNSLHLEQEAFIQTLSEKHPEYYKLKYQFNATTISQIQAQLKPTEAFLEYVVGRDETFLFYISKQQQRLFRLPQNLKSLEPHVRDLHFSLSNYQFISSKTAEANTLFAKSAHFFYKELLSEALALEDQIEHLIIVTDGTLGLLPFEVFLTAPSQDNDFKDYPYLLRDYSIGYHYSATVWSQLSKSKKSTSSSMLAMAAYYPAINRDKQMSTSGMTPFQKLRLALNDLPAAKEEVKSLEMAFDGAFYFDTEASETTFKQEAPNYGIIHLAMHGILDARKPLLSSMAFSEDNKNKEDNFLQAWEISQLKLNANLVVLSACETGFGKFEQGEGILSLARSFMYAGVPSLVVSLWQVNDFATAAIMQGFYTNLSDGMPKAEALRQAKLAFLNRSVGLAAHPAFWSPFVQIGNNDPIQISEKGEMTLWYWLGGVLLFFIVASLFYRRKTA